MHNILQRQVKLVYNEDGPSDKDTRHILEIVSDTYARFDEHIAVLERSLGILSQEIEKKRKLYNKYALNVNEVHHRIEELEEARSVLINILDEMNTEILKYKSNCHDNNNVGTGNDNTIEQSDNMQLPQQPSGDV